MLLLTTLGFGCGSAREVSVQEPSLSPSLGVREIEALVPSRVKDRAVWADAIVNALRANGLPRDQATACAVIAVIAQESGFRADPVVPGLAKLVKARVDQHRDRLGPLGKPVFERLLSGRAPADARTFQERLDVVRTERDVDRLFRDILIHHQRGNPATFGAISAAGKLFDVRRLADLNPITTAGPMQVSVAFAEAWAEQRHGDPGEVREALYTPSGGVYYGTARLFQHQANYDQPMFRFADYNAGLYASRNAALQRQVARITGHALTPDGDLVAYDRNGQPRTEDSQTLRAFLAFRARHASHVTERQLRADVRKEKTRELEETATYREIKRVFAAKTGGTPSYAVLPDVQIESPKLSGTRSTAWFARSVNRRYQACRDTRLGAGP